MECGSFPWEGDLIEGLGLSTGPRSGVAFMNHLSLEHSVRREYSTWTAVSVVGRVGRVGRLSHDM